MNRTTDCSSWLSKTLLDSVKELDGSDSCIQIHHSECILMILRLVSTRILAANSESQQLGRSVSSMKAAML